MPRVLDLILGEDDPSLDFNGSPESLAGLMDGYFDAPNQGRRPPRKQRRPPVTLARFAQLKTGEWGARVENTEVRPGDKLLVLRRGNRDNAALRAVPCTVDAIAWAAEGVTICMIHKGAL